MAIFVSSLLYFYSIPYRTRLSVEFSLLFVFFSHLTRSLIFPLPVRIFAFQCNLNSSSNQRVSQSGNHHLDVASQPARQPQCRKSMHSPWTYKSIKFSFEVRNCIKLSRCLHFCSTTYYMEEILEIGLKSCFISCVLHSLEHHREGDCYMAPTSSLKRYYMDLREVLKLGLCHF